MSVETGTVPTAIPITGHQRQSGLAGTRRWECYRDGSNVVARWSDDGVSWSAPITIRAGGALMCHMLVDNTAGRILIFTSGFNNLSVSLQVHTLTTNYATGTPGSWTTTTIDAGGTNLGTYGAYAWRAEGTTPRYYVVSGKVTAANVYETRVYFAPVSGPDTPANWTNGTDGAAPQIAAFKNLGGNSDANVGKMGVGCYTTIGGNPRSIIVFQEGSADTGYESVVFDPGVTTPAPGTVAAAIAPHAGLTGVDPLQWGIFMTISAYANYVVFGRIDTHAGSAGLWKSTDGATWTQPSGWSLGTVAGRIRSTKMGGKIYLLTTTVWNSNANLDDPMQIRELDPADDSIETPETFGDSQGGFLDAPEVNLADKVFGIYRQGEATPWSMRYEEFTPSGTGGGGGGASTGIQDDFNRADGAPGANWTPIQGTTALEIKGNKLHNTSSSTRKDAAFATVFNQNQEAYNKVGLAGQYQRLFARYDIATETGYMMEYEYDTLICNFYKVTGSGLLTHLGAANALRPLLGHASTFVVPTPPAGGTINVLTEYGTSDTQVRAAVTAAAAQNKQLYFPAGTYTVNGVLTLNNLVAYGDGETTIISMQDRANSCIKLTGAAPRLYNMRITCPTGTSGPRLSTKESTGVLVEATTGAWEVTHMRVDHMASVGIFCYNAKAPSDDQKGKIRWNHVSDTLADGIHITNKSEYVSVEYNEVHDTGDDFIAVVSYDFDNGQCHDVWIGNNNVHDNPWGRGIACVGSYSVDIWSNIVQRSNAAGIYVANEDADTTLNVTNVSIRANYLRDIDRGNIHDANITIWGAKTDTPVNNVSGSVNNLQSGKLSVQKVGAVAASVTVTGDFLGDLAVPSAGFDQLIFRAIGNSLVAVVNETVIGSVSDPTYLRSGKIGVGLYPFGFIDDFGGGNLASDTEAPGLASLSLAAAGSTSVTIRIQMPTDLDVDQVEVRYNVGATYPATNRSDGTVALAATSTLPGELRDVVISGLTLGQQVSVRVFNRDTSGLWNNGAQIQAVTVAVPEFIRRVQADGVTPIADGDTSGGVQQYHEYQLRPEHFKGTAPGHLQYVEGDDNVTPPTVNPQTFHTKTAAAGIFQYLNSSGQWANFPMAGLTSGDWGRKVRVKTRASVGAHYGALRAENKN